MHGLTYILASWLLITFIVDLKLDVRPYIMVYLWNLLSGTYVRWLAWKGDCTVSGNNYNEYSFNNLDVAWYSIIFITDFGFVLPYTFSWLAHPRGKCWCSEALNKRALFYLKLLKDGVGELLCCLMSLLIFYKMGP